MGQWGGTMRGTRGQQIGEYAVLLGIVGLAFVGSQMLMSRRVGGGLIAFSQTVLGTPDAPEGGSSGSTSNSVVTETGDPDRVRTVSSGSASGGSSAGHILAEAYGPYIDVRVMSDAYSSSTSDLSLNGFITDDITSDPDWMINAADGEYDIKAKDVNGDGARDVLAVDGDTLEIIDDEIGTATGKPDDLPNGVLLAVDQLTDLATGEDGEAAWAAALDASEAEPLVTWLSTAGLPGRMEEGFESGNYALPEKGKSQKDLRKERSKNFMSKNSKGEPRKPGENRQYQAFRAFYMNLSESDGFAFSRDDSLEEKLDKYSGYDITTEMGKVDMKADLVATEEDKDPVQVLTEMLHEARDPNSELFARLEADEVFDIDGAAGTPRTKVELLDSEGKVVMFVPVGGTQWETGPDYAGEIQYKTIDIDGHKQSVPYGIQLESGEDGTDGFLEVSLGTFESDLENNPATVDVMRVHSRLSDRDEHGNPPEGEEVVLTTRRTLYGAYSEDGTSWDADTLIGVQEDPTVIPLVSHDSADRKPDAWLVKDTSLEEAVAQGDVPGSVAYLLVKDVNGNGRLDQADQDAVGSTPTFVHNDLKAVRPTKPDERETLKSDVPTGLEAMAADIEPGANILLYRRANPNQVPEEDRGPENQVDTGIVAGDLVQAMAPIRPNDFVNATPQFRLNTDVNALIKASTGESVDDAKIIELFQGGLSTALASSEFSYEEQESPLAGQGPTRPKLSFAQRIGVSMDLLRGILSVSGERNGFTETDIDRALLGLDLDESGSNFSLTPRQP